MTSRSTGSAVFAYGMALASLAAALLLRWLLDPVLEDTLPVAAVFGAVGIAVWVGGYRPALVVVALGYLACAYLFIEPRGQLGLSEPRNLVGLLLFLATAFIIVGFGEALRRARQLCRRGEEAARQQAELQRTTLASIGDGVIVTDADGRISDMNPVAEALTGWTRDEAAGVPLSQVFRIVDEADRRELENPALRAMKEGVIVGPANPSLLVAKDGTERPIDDNAAPIRGNDAGVVGSVLVFRDISERQQAEVEGRQAQQQIATTLESVTDGFMRYDRDWRIVYVNAEAERINRLTREVMLGRTLWEVFPAVVGTRLEVEFRRAMADRVTVEFDNHYEPFGRWYSLKAYPAADGGLTTFIRDITEHKRVEQRLVESEARYRAIGESIDFGVWVCDAEGRNTYASESFLRLVGMTQQQCSALGWTDVLHPDDAAATIAAWQECVRTQGTWDREHRFKGVDGQWYHVLARGVPLRDGTGELYGWAGINLDVTRLVQTEREVSRLADESDRQRRLYEAVLTNTPDFVYVFSLDHTVVYANDALIDMWGRGKEGAIGKTFLEIGYEPWHAERHDREIDQVRATRQPIRGEVPFTGTQGRRQYDYIFVPVFGADGEVEAVAGTTRDVTERKDIEERLRTSEERQAFLVALADTLRPLSDPIAVQAEASRILGERLGANRVVYFEVRGDDYVVERDYTHAVPSVVGRHSIASFGPDQLALYRAGSTAVEADVDALAARATSEKEAFAAVRIRSYVGVPLVKGGVFVAGLAVHSASVRAWTPTEVAIIEETAERTWAAVERVRAEAALRASEDHRRLALDAAELGAFNIDPTNNTLSTDERFRVIFAGDTAALNYEQAFAAVHPDDRDRIRDAVAAATRLNDPAPYAEEFRVVHPDGSIRWIFAKGRANVDRERTGRLISFDGTIADITARKLIEEERERLVGQLRNEHRRKDEFLATLSHELRNPLAPIRNGLHVMRLAGTPETIAQAHAMMERQLTQLVRLVDDLLDVSRVTSGKLELRRERVEMSAVIDAAMETTRSGVEQAGHALSVVVPDDPIYVEGDAIRLAQIVSNLLSNSAKYTPMGGRIRVSVSREDGMAVLAVADDGIGIPPAMLRKVFEMFAQVDRALEKTAGGLGIGLSLVEGLVGMHGGTIEARSEGEGRGSEFIVRLPLSAPAVGEAGPPDVARPVRPASRRRILVTDDNVDSADSLAQLLELLGNEVSVAYDGLQAVDIAQAFRPDVVLLDIGMPNLNGYEACRRIRAQPWAKDVIVVAMTGWGQEEDRRRSQDAGFDRHLVKPVDPAEVEKLLTYSKRELMRP